MTLLVEHKTGWTFPPRSHKAHCFDEDGKSLCGKYSIKWSNGPAYLSGCLLYEKECCKKCLKGAKNG